MNVAMAYARVGDFDVHVAGADGTAVNCVLHHRARGVLAGEAFRRNHLCADLRADPGLSQEVL